MIGAATPRTPIPISTAHPKPLGILLSGRIASHTAATASKSQNLEPKTAAAVTVFCAITVVVILQRKRQPWLLTGWFWYVITLVPVIGIVQVGFQAMADRYTYIPSIGIFVLLCWLLPKSLFHHPRA